MQIVIATSNQEAGTGGLQQHYESFKRGEWAYFDQVTVAGYPAAFSYISNLRSEGECGLAVGIRDDLVFAAIGQAFAAGRDREEMEAAFTGDVGDAAATSMLPMMKTLRYSGEQMDVTKALTEHQAQMWHDADNSVVRVPPAPQKPSAWSQRFKRLTFQGDEADAADASYEAGVARRDSANQHDVDVYNRYCLGTGSVSSRFPPRIRKLRDTGGDIDIVEHKGTAGDDRKHLTHDLGKTTASSVSTPSGSVGSSVSGTPGVQGTGALPGGGGGLQPGAQTGAGGVQTNPAGGIGTGPAGGGPAPANPAARPPD